MGHFSYNHLPAKGIGLRRNKPHVTGGLGYAPLGSLLPPVDSIVSVEPVGRIVGSTLSEATSSLPDDLTSLEPLVQVEGSIPGSIVSSDNRFGVTYYAEEEGFTIIEFGYVTQNFGQASGFARIAQTGYGQGDMNVSSVVLKMRNVGGATDTLYLDLRVFSSFGIPENPPFLPEDGELVATASVDGSEISDTLWTDVVFRFDEPVELPYDWALVLRRSEPDDAKYYYFQQSTFANFSSGALWAYFGGNWLTGGTADLPMVVNQVVLKSRLIESEELRDIVSQEPDDVESEEPT